MQCSATKVVSVPHGPCQEDHPVTEPGIVQCAVCNVQCVVCSVQYTVFNVQCVVCNVPCVMCAVCIL